MLESVPAEQDFVATRVWTRDLREYGLVTLKENVPGIYFPFWAGEMPTRTPSTAHVLYLPFFAFLAAGEDGALDGASRGHILVNRRSKGMEGIKFPLRISNNHLCRIRKLAWPQETRFASQACPDIAA